MDYEIKSSNAEHFETRRTSNVDDTVLKEKKIQVHNVTLAGVLQDNKPSVTGKGYIKLYLICALVYLCSTMNGRVSMPVLPKAEHFIGYDGSLMGSINAMRSYTEYYNLPPEGNSGTGIVFAIFQVGQMVGALFMWVIDWQGRRMVIFVGCLGVCVGAIVTAVAPTLGGFIGGRFLLSFFATLATGSAAVYLIELAPPQYRGTVAGMYNTLYYLVSIPSRVVCRHGAERFFHRAQSSQRVLSTVLTSI